MVTLFRGIWLSHLCMCALVNPIKYIRLPGMRNRRIKFYFILFLSKVYYLLWGSAFVSAPSPVLTGWDCSKRRSAKTSLSALELKGLLFPLAPTSSLPERKEEEEKKAGVNTEMQLECPFFRPIPIQRTNVKLLNDLWIKETLAAYQFNISKKDHNNKWVYNIA